MPVKRSSSAPALGDLPTTTSSTAKALGLSVAALAAMPSAEAATFTVTNLNDSGAGSLRQAIVDANGAAGADVVNFQAALSGTITLTTGQLAITDSVDIQGPGAATITVSGNDASRVFYLYNGSTTLNVRIAGLTVTDGDSNIGAGIVNFDEDLTLENLVITGNAATGDGGGLWADGFNMDLTIRNCTISGNTAGDDGGGIYVEDTGGLLLIENSVISGNQAAGAGGGIYFYDPDDDITIRGTTISGNTAGTIGGGVYMYDTDGGQVRIESSTISGNSADAGGGIFLYGPDDPVTIENTTISGNQATSGNGGGIYLYSLYDNPVLNFVTIASNSASGEGGGAFSNNPIVELSNSIVADNTAGTNNDLGTAGDGDFGLTYTLVETPGTASITDNGGNLLSTDPQLGALQNNGGSTQTHRPAIASPVINVADPAFAPPPADDQRGEDRVIGGRADMGALEINGGTIQFNPQTASIGETGGSVSLTVVRNVGPDPATVQYTTNAGTAAPGAGNDYTTAAGTLTFAAGDLSESIVVPILDDNVAEGNETFTATLSTPSAGAAIGAANPATVTITDDPAGTAQFTLAAVSTTEEALTLNLTVTRTGGTEGPLSVSYATANGTATAPSDFAAAAGVITFPAGNAAPQTITINLVNDLAQEPAETFTVGLTGAAVGTPSTVTVTIEAGDVPAIPVPGLSLLGKLLLAALTSIAGLWAILRNRVSLLLAGVLLAAVAAAPPLTAAEGRPSKTHAESKAKETKSGKVRGVLQTLVNENGKWTITLTGGTSIVVDAKDASIIDRRTGKPENASLTDLTAGRSIVVHTKKNGKVTIKIVA